MTHPYGYLILVLLYFFAIDTIIAMLIMFPLAAMKNKYDIELIIAPIIVLLLFEYLWYLEYSDNIPLLLIVILILMKEFMKRSRTLISAAQYGEHKAQMALIYYLIAKISLFTFISKQIIWY